MSAPYQAYSFLTLEEIEAIVKSFFCEEKETRIVVESVDDTHYKVTTKGFNAVVSKKLWNDGLKKAITEGFLSAAENSQRKTGRTTRLADQLIQELFTKGKTVVVDHSESLRANNNLWYIIINRLKTEHPGVVFELDASRRTITLRK